MRLFQQSAFTAHGAAIPLMLMVVLFFSGCSIEKTTTSNASDLTLTEHTHIEQTGADKKQCAQNADTANKGEEVRGPMNEEASLPLHMAE